MSVGYLSSLQAAVLACTLGSLALGGCAPNFVAVDKHRLIGSGFQTVAALQEIPKNQPVVIWSNHEQVEGPLLQRLEQLHEGDVGNVLVQRAFMEQRKKLPSVPHDLHILEAARQAGAHNVIIAEITIRPVPGDNRFYTHVAARAFAVEARTMRWSGTAQCALPVKDAELVVISLARVAVALGTGRSADDLDQQSLRSCTGGEARFAE